jgi:hypothetical protein
MHARRDFLVSGPDEHVQCGVGAVPGGGEVVLERALRVEPERSWLFPR